MTVQVDSRESTSSDSVQSRSAQASGHRSGGHHFDDDAGALALAMWLETKDPEWRARLAERYDGLALNIARRFRDRGESADDLGQVARIGLLKSIDRFDPEFGTPFGAFATVTMVGEIRRHFRDTTWHVYVPRRIKDLQTAIRWAVEALTHEHGRPPTTRELAECLGIDEEKVLEGLDGANAYRADSLDDQPSHRNSPAVDRLIDPSASPESTVGILDLLERLPARERKIVELRYFSGLSQSEIAEQVGLSQVHVSRLLRSTLATLRASL